jgi:AcrR family transcriptional regulator
MARRSDHTRQELKQLAINSGLKMLEQGGLKAITTRKITNEIGYTVGTFYQIFENLDDFILHLNYMTLCDILDKIKNNVNCRKDLDSIRNLAFIYLDYAESNLNRWMSLFDHRLKDLPDWYSQKLDEIFSLIENCLEDTIKNVEERKNSARVLWSALHGISMLSVTGKLEIVNSYDSRALVNNFLDNYLSGITINKRADT